MRVYGDHIIKAADGIIIKTIQQEKGMACGMRDTSKTPLSDCEIEFVKKEIKRIEADESKFIFNVDRNKSMGTRYNYLDDSVDINFCHR